MSKKPYYWSRAIKALSKKDKVMKGLILKYQDKTLTTRKDLFYSLCKSIIGQQISVVLNYCKAEDYHQKYFLKNL
mgnify:CR=1 FL=1